MAKTIADQLRVHLTGREEEVIAAKPTDNPEAYDAYLRGLAFTLKTQNTPGNYLGAQKYFREAVRLDPKFALAWALLSYVDARGYRTLESSADDRPARGGAAGGGQRARPAADVRRSPASPRAFIITVA